MFIEKLKYNASMQCGSFLSVYKKIFAPVYVTDVVEHSFHI